MQIHGECRMALNVKQLQDLQDKIGSEFIMPDSLSRLSALKDLKSLDNNKFAQATDQRYSRQFKNTSLEGGGQPNLSEQVQNIAQKGRMGDSMLMHVNPEEVRGLSSVAPITVNPETGLPEAFAPAVLALAAGAGFAGAGTAVAGAGIMAGLSGMWGALGPIGQGMLIGGGMGGIKSLITGGDNPLRDVLLGAALGGLGPALSGGTATGAELAASDAFTAGAGPSITVPEVTATLPAAASSGGVGGGSNAFLQGARGLNPRAALSPSLSSAGVGQFGPQMITPTLSAPVSPVTHGLSTYPVTHGPGTYNAPSLPYTSPTPVKSPVTARPGLDAAGKPLELAPFKDEASKRAHFKKYGGKEEVTPSDKTFFGDLKDWWKEREWYEKAGIAGLGTLAGTELLSRPREQQQVEGLKPVQPFAQGDPKIPLKPISPLTEEQIRTAYTGPSGTGIDTYFQPAKEGGLLSVTTKQGGGSFYDTPRYAAGLTDRPDAMIRPYAGVGDPRYAKPLSLKDWNALYGPGAAGADDDDGGGGGVSALNPFVFPDTTPFQSNLSSFNLGDRLGRITGQNQFPQVPVVLPEQVTTPVSPNIPVPTDTSALGDLFKRFEQTAQIDPIAGLVAPAVGINQGGTVGLARGGIFEGRVQGQGDGMADKVAFGVRPQTPKDIPNTPDVALLSSDEYVVPADVVSMLGNGSSTAGAQSLDKFNKLMRKKAHGTNKQQRQLNAGKELSSLV